MKRKTPVAAAREAAEKRLRAHELRWSPKKHKHRKHVSASRDSRGVSPQRLARQTTDANKKESAAPGAKKMTGDGEFACDDIDLATAIHQLSLASRQRLRGESAQCVVDLTHQKAGDTAGSATRKEDEIALATAIQQPLVRATQKSLRG